MFLVVVYYFCLIDIVFSNYFGRSSFGGTVIVIRLSLIEMVNQLIIFRGNPLSLLSIS